MSPKETMNLEQEVKLLCDVLSHPAHFHIDHYDSDGKATRIQWVMSDEKPWEVSYGVISQKAVDADWLSGYETTDAFASLEDAVRFFCKKRVESKFK
jgi:hypothetical protein